MNNYPNIELCEKNSLAAYEAIIKGIDNKLVKENSDIIVYGSLARREYMQESDIDWTYLIDGEPFPELQINIEKINNQLQALGLKLPGSEGIFAKATYKDELVNLIGGGKDTNETLTKRILLILESFPLKVNSQGKPVHNKILRKVIEQYIIHDSGFKSPHARQEKVPRFLLNDIVRFWRTLCVDFAYKQKEQDGKKWAIRNIKLRMARKLIFCKGLLLCFSCYKNDSIDENNIADHLTHLAELSPLDIIKRVLGKMDLFETDIEEILNSYDNYLSFIHDVDKRNHLLKINMLEAYSDEIFLEGRTLSNKFQELLNTVFIRKQSELSEFTLKYGIF